MRTTSFVLALLVSLATTSTSHSSEQRGLTFVVNDSADLVDSNPGDGACATVNNTCTLRAAVMENNASALGGHTIELGPAAYRLSLIGPGDAGGDLDIDKDVLVAGAGANLTTVEAFGTNDVLRAFLVNPGVSLTLSDLAVDPRDNFNGADIEGTAIKTEENSSLALHSTRILPGLGFETSLVDHGGSQLTISNSQFLLAGADFGVRVAPTSGVSSVSIDNPTFVVQGFATTTAIGLFPVDSVVTANLNSLAFTGREGIRIRPESSAGMAEVHLTVVESRFQSTIVGIFASTTVPGAPANTITLDISDTEFLGVFNTTLDSTGLIVEGRSGDVRDVVVRSSMFSIPPGDEGIRATGFATVTLENVTLDGDGSGSVPIVGSFSDNDFSLNNVTVNGRFSARPGDSLVMHNSIVTGGCFVGSFSGGNNVLSSSPSDCDGTNDVIGDPQLQPLADNGGSTRTMAILDSSIATDAGSNAAVGSAPACLATDQRGVVRPMDGNGDETARCDIGAFEIDPPILRDFGDADAPFQTLEEFDGPWHEIGTLFLGASIDDELNGQPSTNYNGDDTNGTDDEDGLSFSPIIRGQMASVDVVASEAGGLFSLWIEGFGGQPDRGAVAVQVFADIPLNQGLNQLAFPVPVSALLSNRGARARLSSEAGLALTGSAVDGEVEDYLVFVQEEVDLAITGDVVPAEAFMGQTVDFTFEIENSGPGYAEEVLFDAVLSSNLVFEQVACTPVGDASCNGGGEPPGRGAEVVVGIGPGASVILDLSVTIVDSGSGDDRGMPPLASVTATVSLDEDNPRVDLNLSNNTVTVDLELGLLADGFETGSADAWSCYCGNRSLLSCDSDLQALGAPVRGDTAVSMSACQ